MNACKRKITYRSANLEAVHTPNNIIHNSREYSTYVPLYKTEKSCWRILLYRYEEIFTQIHSHDVDVNKTTISIKSALFFILRSREPECYFSQHRAFLCNLRIHEVSSLSKLTISIFFFLHHLGNVSSSMNLFFPLFCGVAFFIWDEPKQKQSLYGKDLFILYLLNPKDSTIRINAAVVKEEFIEGKNQNGRP